LQASMSDSFSTLINLGRFESGFVPLTLEPVDLSALALSLHNQQQPFAQAKGLDLRIRCSAGQLLSDRQAIERIVRNLVTNAIHYTDNGGVLVAIRKRLQCLLIQVWDTGPGISQAEQKKLFHIYTRSQKNVATHSGAGMGLAIVQHLVELLGGTVSVKSRLGRGSLFQVVIPVNEPTPEVLPAASSSQQNFEIILDLPSGERLNQISQCLSRWGYTTTPSNRSAALVVKEWTDATALKQMEEFIKPLQAQYTNVVFAVVAQKPEPALVQHLKTLNVHFLSPDFRPAQLRSLLKYLESFADLGKP